MIVAFTSGGQLGNQLMFAANMMASSLEFDIPYRNIAFQASAYFEIKDTTQNRYISNKNLFSRLVTKYMYGMQKIHGGGVPGIRIILNDEYEAKELFVHSEMRLPTFLHCWPYLDFDSLYKRQDDIRRIIRPLPRWIEEAGSKIDKIKKRFPNSALVGVHIRRKDYKNFLGGRYFYSYDVYRERMGEVARQIHGNTIFLLFSDEKIDKELFENERLYQTEISCNSAIVDLVMMSSCDYLIGPPSTFSGWASFWGKVPKHIMVDSETQILSVDGGDFGIYMIDVMDNEEDETGRKIITRFSEGRKLSVEGRTKL